MPIEIRELHIKVSVTSPEATQGSTGTTSPGGRSNSYTGGNNNEEIVAACVEKVMEILQNKRER
jgi:hypothetical protein